MYFDPTSEFEILKEKRKISKNYLNDLWDDAEYYYPGLMSALGVFVFSIRTSKHRKPWYVGKSDKSGFERDVFTKKKLSLYNEALKRQKGVPYITFIPALTKTGRFVKTKKKPNPSIDALHKMLIGASLHRNKSLLNVKQNGQFGKLVLPGLINTPRGRSKWEVSEFKKLIGAK